MHSTSVYLANVKHCFIAIFLFIFPCFVAYTVLIIILCFEYLQVTSDAHFINDLGLDSLDVVEVIMAFEDEFGGFYFGEASLSI